MSKQIVVDIDQVLHKVDLINRPKIAFIHPDDAELLKNDLPEIEEKMVIRITPIIEKGKAIIMNREDIEKWENPFNLTI